MNIIEKKMTSIALFLASALFLFLPFSSWLVSLSGIVWVSLIRDILVGLIFICALFKIKKFRFNFQIGLALLFCLYLVLTYFWREAGILQWLKGARFLLMPVVLFLSLSTFSFSDKQKKLLLGFVFASAIIVSAIAALELFRIYIPLTTRFSDVGALERGSFVGKIQIVRLQSILSGPNALGLYLLATLGFAVTLLKNSYLKVIFSLIIAILLILTFSRSALLGFAVLAIIYMILYLKLRKLSSMLLVAITVATIIMISVGGYAVYRNENTRDLIVHNDSTQVRFSQYVRVWNSRNEIGFFGRGAGTAGPASQNRIDVGENHFTENIYLDIYEELGLIGLVVYLVLIGSFIVYAYKRVERSEGLGAFLLLVAFFFSGFFVNYYTGQAGIFLIWLMVGLLIQPKMSKS